jgi:23S rRNA (uracil1939-C5)-methyltransferase
MVRDSLARIGGVTDIDVPSTQGMDDPWLYRNRAEYTAQITPNGEVAVGFARYHSHEIVPLTECRLQHPLSEQVRAALVNLVNRVAQSPTERAAFLGLETLISFRDGRGLATLICDGRPPFVESLAQALSEHVPYLAGILYARRRGRSLHRSPSEIILGESHIIEELASETYRVSADSFFQASPTQATRAIDLVKEWGAVEEDDVVFDLYSGVGTFLLPLARIARRSFGIEESAAAVRDAHANRRHWGVTGVRLYERRVERLLPKWVEQRRTANVILLDPPRKGCGPIVLSYVAKLNARRIVLVSCHPATLARDLKTLAEFDYRPTRLQPLDMFPQTWHVETVVSCERTQA